MSLEDVVYTIANKPLTVVLQEDMLKAWGWVLGYSVIFATVSAASVAVSIKLLI